jgi:transposase
LVDHAPAGHWQTTTLVAGITVRSIISPMILSGAMDSEAFLAWVEQSLLPELPRRAIVVMDNLGPHHAPKIQCLVKKVRAQVRYLPAYSPDFNPIELAWAEVKSCLRGAKARTPKQLQAAIARALDLITPQKARAFFKHCFVGIKS